MEVIFDLGNVVLDWNVDKIINRLRIEEHERNLLRKELFEHSDWLELDSGMRSEKDIVFRVNKRSGLTVATIENALQTAKASLKPIPESLQLLNELYNKDINMYCLSNMSVETYEYVRGQAFFNLFKGIIISGQEKCIKPDSRIFKLIIKRYNLNPTHTLFIDDSLPNVAAANEQTLIGFHFQRTKTCYSKIRKILK